MEPHLTWWNRIWVRTILMVVTLSVLPIGLLVAITFVSTAGQYTARVKERQQAIALRALDRVESFLSEIETCLVSLAQDPAFRGVDRKTQENTLAVHLKAQPSIRTLGFIDSNGWERAKVSREETFGPGDLRESLNEPCFQYAMAGMSSIGEVYRSSYGEPMVPVAVPVPSLLHRTPLGAISAELSLHTLWEEITAIPVGEHGYVYVVDHRGRLIGHPDKSLVLAGRVLIWAPIVRALMQEDGEPPRLFYPSFDGVRVAGWGTKSSQFGWMVIAEEHAAEALAPLRRSAASALAIIGITAIAAVSAATALALRLTRPLAEVERGATRIAEGDLTHEIRVRTQDEAGRLASAFNRMAEALRKRDEELTAGRHQLELILQSVADGVVVIDGEKRLLAINPAAESMLGLRAHQVIGARLEEDRQDEGWKALKEVVADRRRQSVPVTSERRKRRSYHPTWQKDVTVGEPYRMALRIITSPLMENGTESGRVFVLADMTAIREVDRMRQHFISTVYHEFQNPLVLIRSYADLIARGRLGNVSDEQADRLERVIHQTDQLSRLVSGMLDLARIEATGPAFQMVDTDLTEVVHEAVENVRVLADKKEIRLVSELPSPLPRVLTDREALGHILDNLLSNALKFTLANGKVSVSARIHGNWVEVDISDTGVGISREDLPRIFDEFYRGSAASTKAEWGAGFGLAIVKRLVEKMGGRVWVESKPGEGSKFTFSLRKA